MNRLHCDTCDRHITKGERYLEYRLLQENQCPVIMETLCIDDALEHGQAVAIRFFAGSWAGLTANWREAF